MKRLIENDGSLQKKKKNLFKSMNNCLIYIEHSIIISNIFVLIIY